MSGSSGPRTELRAAPPRRRPLPWPRGGAHKDWRSPGAGCGQLGGGVRQVGGGDGRRRLEVTAGPPGCLFLRLPTPPSCGAGGRSLEVFLAGGGVSLCGEPGRDEVTRIGPLAPPLPPLPTRGLRGVEFAEIRKGAGRKRAGLRVDRRACSDWPGALALSARLGQGHAHTSRVGCCGSGSCWDWMFWLPQFSVSSCWDAVGLRFRY